MNLAKIDISISSDQKGEERLEAVWSRIVLKNLFAMCCKRRKAGKRQLSLCVAYYQIRIRFLGFE